MDDELNVLQGLKRLLRSKRDEWETIFAQSGSEALELLSQAPIDVVVTDMLMPGMDGPALLTTVSKSYPDVVRIILSGTADRDKIMRSLAPTHQYLSKPCDPELLKTKLARTFALRDLLTDSNLKGLLGEIKSLPSLPTLYLELMQELQSPQGTLGRVGEVIAKDVGMTAKILQLVNSAYFGLQVQVSSPVHATQLLGLDAVRALVLSAKVFEQFDQSRLAGVSLSALLDHSQRVGVFARTICQSENQPNDMEGEALMAGILHDAGKLIMASNFPEEYETVQNLRQEQSLEFWQAEQEIFGASHAEIGAYLLGLWGLPDPIVEAVAFHHRPHDCLSEKFSPLTAVHVANAFERELHGEEDESMASQIDEEHLSRLTLIDRLVIWRATCHKTA